MDLMDELESRILCGDGAMGTLLFDQGIPRDSCLEQLCLTQPGRIEQVHQLYIEAGARVIQTNTFGANSARLETFGLADRVGEINRAAAKIAREAARGKNIYIAGSVGPLGIGRDEAELHGIDREECFHEQITALVEAGVQLIFLETFTHLEEMQIALRVRQKIGPGLTICSFAAHPGGELRCGTSLRAVFGKAHELKPHIVGINCADPNVTTQSIDSFLKDSSAVAAYPNAGDPIIQNKRLKYPVSTTAFAMVAKDLVDRGVRLIGGCCGTTPEHIAATTAAIGQLQPILP